MMQVLGLLGWLVASGWAADVVDAKYRCAAPNSRDQTEERRDEILRRLAKSDSALRIDGVDYGSDAWPVELLNPALVSTLGQFDGVWIPPHRVHRETLGDLRVLFRMRDGLAEILTAPESPAQPEVTIDNLRARYNLGAFKDVTASWGPESLHALDAAMSLLSPMERQAAEGVLFERHRDEDSGFAGRFHSGEGATLKLYDAAFPRCEGRFEGDPTVRAPVGTGVAVHELGHAFAGLIRTRRDELRTGLWDRRNLGGVQRDIMRSWLRRQPWPSEAACTGLDSVQPDDTVTTFVARMIDRAAQPDAEHTLATWRVQATRRASRAFLAEVVRRWEAGETLDDAALMAHGDGLAAAEKQARDQLAAHPDSEVHEAAAAYVRSLNTEGVDEGIVVQMARAWACPRDVVGPLDQRMEDEGLSVLITSLQDDAPVDAVLEVYEALEGAVPGPTLYAATNLAESFAESFELWHLDPRSLEEVAPEVYAWFVTRGHERALEKALAEIEELARLK